MARIDRTGPTCSVLTPPLGVLTIFGGLIANLAARRASVEASPVGAVDAVIATHEITRSAAVINSEKRLT